MNSGNARTSRNTTSSRRGTDEPESFGEKIGTMFYNLIEKNATRGPSTPRAGNAGKRIRSR